MNTLSKCRKVTQNKIIEQKGIYTCFAVTIASFILMDILQNAFTVNLACLF